jgi:hypothetical protein
VTQLPVVPTAAVQTWSDLATWALIQAGVAPQASLYTNDYQPDSTTTLAMFLSPIAAGLGPIALPPPVFAGLNACGRARWNWGSVTWTAFGGGLPVLVFGYYVWCTDPITGLPALLWAQRFPNAFGFVNPGDQLTVPLSDSFASC